jgi:hypothetical protein
VRRLIPASVAAFGLFLLTFYAPVTQAQIATSGSSTHSESGVTSGRTNGYSGSNPSFHHSNCCTNPTYTVSSKPPQSGSQHPHHHPFPAAAAIYAVPYAVSLTEPNEAATADDDSAEQQPDPADSAPGPTIFDRRGSSQPSSVAEAAYDERLREAQRDEPSPQSAETPADPAPLADRPPTMLVFKDGHQLEVQNYAIVGVMLYDMTPGHRTRIAVVDLDLSATAKENDNRGIDFQLPVRPATNPN